MPLFRDLPESDKAIVNELLEEFKFPAGTCIMKQGSEGRGCYFIDEG